MNKLTLLLFGVLLCLAMVNARHYGNNNEETLETEDETLRRPRDFTQVRRRRRRWQTNYGYDYPSPPQYYYPERRDYDRNAEVLQHITKLLEEISAYIRRPPPPPPPPQPIYIPYPMPFMFPQIYCKPQSQNQNKTDGKTPGVDMRISDKDMDPNQNWGLVVSSENDYDDGSDGSRPISFDPIVPKQVMKRPAPKVEHGSVQASQSTEPPRFADEAPPLASASIPVPGMCNAAILSCCGMSNNKAAQGQCFSNIGCSAAFADGNGCTAASIKNALESFRQAYSPVN